MLIHASSLSAFPISEMQTQKPTTVKPPLLADK
jgi:hypothetical protein